ncbi:uncharacterized protein N7515_001923 [Penicillium bovifimosum]|uniref:Uncharacterized protein n=1 Tax=Penicillium bovifimosum TaxID=126998 RepID=A0A9W9HCF3_9EURO|nr:uncharacterized protein N7515_001923 [Penicillium bovifimosum]KAJ5143136.1 hypothetical protein N7515_001923 [Penicillium bovifimosum]
MSSSSITDFINFINEYEIPTHAVVALIIYNNTDFVISRMEEAYGVHRTRRQQTNAENDVASQLKAEIDEQRRRVEAASVHLNSAASAYDEQMRALINKVERLDELDPAFALNVDSVNETIVRDRNTMKDMFWKLAGFAGLKRINRRSHGKDNGEGEGFVMIPNNIPK